MPKGQPKKIEEIQPFAKCSKCGWSLYETDTDLRDNGTPKMWLTKGKGKHTLITRVLLCPKCGKLTRKGKRVGQRAFQRGDWLG